MSIKHLGGCTLITRVSCSPSKIPYGGFSPVRLQGWLSTVAFPFGYRRPVPVQFAYRFRARFPLHVSPHCVGDAGVSSRTAMQAVLPLYPRGPRSGPGSSVLVHLHLFDPIRPTDRHIAFSLPCNLYALPSLCIAA